MLKAMACGPLVLVTSVGAIPDVIIDSKVGFTMENNSPACIVEDCDPGAEPPKLGGGHESWEAACGGNFSFEGAIENWKEILQSID